MKKTKNSKQYDLEERTLSFARRIREFVRKIPKGLLVNNDVQQLLRSSGSVGANYIEANESLSKKDFVHRVKISRKETKESRYWLLLLDFQDKDILREQKELINESTELLKIFSAIVAKSK